MMAANAMSAASTSSSRVFTALLEEVLNAQRALTRCLIKRDADLRESRKELRDRAIATLQAWVETIDLDRRQQRQRADRLTHEVEQIRLILAAASESAPLLVAEAEARTTAVLRVDETRLAAYRQVVEQLVASGHAKRLNGDVVITIAGLLELQQAQKARDVVDELRTENFQLERRVRELEQRTNAGAMQDGAVNRAVRGAGA